MVDHLKKSVLYSCAGALLLSALLFVRSGSTGKDEEKLRNFLFLTYNGMCEKRKIEKDILWSVI